MNLDELKRILDLVRDHELAEFELEHEGLRLKIRKDAAAVIANPGAQVPPFGAVPAVAMPVVAGAAPAPVPAPEPAAQPEGGNDIELAVVKSPIVGTFYRASEPSAPPFVEIGSIVKKGQVLCIIEAMKLMNEIDSEYDGEIVNVYVENGQPVQYGERLFAIRTKAAA
jgi:acetyl-CoA carboxylase biotin carboxyl carrier protein